MYFTLPGTITLSKRVKPRVSNASAVALALHAISILYNTSALAPPPPANFFTVRSVRQSQFGLHKFALFFSKTNLKTIVFGMTFLPTFLRKKDY